MQWGATDNATALADKYTRDAVGHVHTGLKSFGRGVTNRSGNPAKELDRKIISELDPDLANLYRKSMGASEGALQLATVVGGPSAIPAVMKALPVGNRIVAGTAALSQRGGQAMRAIPGVGRAGAGAQAVGQSLNNTAGKIPGAKTLYTKVIKPAAGYQAFDSAVSAARGDNPMPTPQSLKQSLVYAATGLGKRNPLARGPKGGFVRYAVTPYASEKIPAFGSAPSQFGQAGLDAATKLWGANKNNLAAEDYTNPTDPSPDPVFTWYGRIPACDSISCICSSLGGCRGCVVLVPESTGELPEEHSQQVPAVGTTGSGCCVATGVLPDG